MKLAATIICLFIELGICTWQYILRPLFTIAAVGAVILLPVAIPALICHYLGI